MRLPLVVLILFVLPLYASAQITLTGKVLSMVNKQPVADASVFLSNSTVGAKTAADGTFTLYNVKNGQYDLVVTHIGFETAHQTVMASSNMELPAISLMPKITVLKEVKVKYDPSRARYLAMFQKEFLGHSANAKDCVIKNPDVIDLDYDKRGWVLKASSDDFLIIENLALGYTIKYLLVEFTLDQRNGSIFYAGSTVFEPMKGKPSQEKRWQRNRNLAYFGSSKHFLQSALGERIADEGFTVKRLIRAKNPDRLPDSLIQAKLKRWRFTITPANPFPDSLSYWGKENLKPKTIATLINTPLDPKEYIKLTEKDDIFAFGYKDCLQISYKNKEKCTSVVTFSAPYSFFDMNGIVLNLHSNVLEGYWADLRIAELLPVDFTVPTGAK